MNTYTITCFPPGSSTPQPPLTLQADEFMLDRDFVAFLLDNSGTPVTVCAIPTALNPLIQRTSTA